MNRFGDLTIITNDSILTLRLGRPPNLPAGHELPEYVFRTPYAFNQVPTAVVPGPDGTLYIVKNSIFAINPNVGMLERANPAHVIPLKLWDVLIENPGTARITLSPDGRFLYALAQFTGSKSRFIAINAQTGKATQLVPGKVNTSGKNITWVSDMKFDATTVGQTIPVGSGLCTVERAGAESLTCKEDMGTHTGVTWADFPANLNTFRNPVVARGQNGVDFIDITGNSGSGATLWGVRNNPMMQNGSLIAQFTGVWKYPLEEKSTVGQPILDPTIPREGEGLSRKKLYFLEGGAGKAKLTAVKALDGTKVAETPEPTGLLQGMNTDGNPVVDAAGRIVLWANGSLYVFGADTARLSTYPTSFSTPPQLLLGALGHLYAAEPDTVHTVFGTR